MVAITQLSAEKNLHREVVLSAVESALVSAYRKDSFAPNQNLVVKINPSTGGVKVFVKKTVAEKVVDSVNELTLAAAHKIDKNARVGDTLTIELIPDPMPAGSPPRRQGRSYSSACTKQNTMPFTRSLPAERVMWSPVQFSVLHQTTFSLTWVKLRQYYPRPNKFITSVIVLARD